MPNQSGEARRHIAEIVGRLLAEDPDRATALRGHADVVSRNTSARRAVLAAVMATAPRSKAGGLEPDDVAAAEAARQADFAALAERYNADEMLSQDELSRFGEYLTAAGLSVEVTEE